MTSPYETRCARPTADCAAAGADVDEGSFAVGLWRCPKIEASATTRMTAPPTATSLQCFTDVSGWYTARRLSISGDVRSSSEGPFTHFLHNLILVPGTGCLCHLDSLRGSIDESVADTTNDVRRIKLRRDPRRCTMHVGPYDSL